MSLMAALSAVVELEVVDRGWACPLELVLDQDLEHALGEGVALAEAGREGVALGRRVASGWAFAKASSLPESRSLARSADWASVRSGSLTSRSGGMPVLSMFSSLGV